MAKPTADTLWSTTGTKVEPSGGVKAAGWAVSQRPPAQWLNFWMNAVYQWVVWLAAFEDTAHTWTTGTQTYATPVILAVGATFQGGTAFNVNSGASFNWLSGSTFHVATGATFDVDAAADFSGAMTIGGLTTFNGATDFNSTINADGVATFNAAIFAFGAAEFDALVTTLAGISAAAAGAVPGITGTGTGTVGGGRFVSSSSSGAAGAEAVVPSGGNVGARAMRIYRAAGTPTTPDTATHSILADIWGKLLFRGPNALYYDALQNQLSPSSITKAWVMFELDTAAGGTAILKQGMGLEIALPVAFDSATGKITVYFSVNMSSAFYAWSMSLAYPGSIVNAVNYPVAGLFANRIEFYIQGGGGSALTSTLDGSIWSCIVVGNQAQV